MKYSVSILLQPANQKAIRENMLRRAGLVLGGATVYAGATLVSYVYFVDVDDKDSHESMTSKERIEIYDENADDYDLEIQWDEHVMGITLMRNILLKKAKGHVLEVCAGTGRNLKYYSPDCRVTCTDASAKMLQRAKELCKDINPSASFYEMESERLTFPPESFDTVVDTFGLCSVENPVDMLEELARMCKKDGKILLLEHGRSNYNWMSFVLDKYAAKHAKRWGCVWNRDILDLIQQANLEIVTSHRFHFNTTHYIVAKPRK